MTDRDEHLANFFSGYFNQDWSVGGATSWRDVVTQFVKENTHAHALLVLHGLRSWLADTAAGPNPTQGLPAEFGCDYDPQVDRMSEREWVREIAELLSVQLAS